MKVLLAPIEGVTLERFADATARLEKAGDARAPVFAELGLDEDAWDRVRRAWEARLAGSPRLQRGYEYLRRQFASAPHGEGASSEALGGARSSGSSLDSVERPSYLMANAATPQDPERPAGALGAAELPSFMRTPEHGAPPRAQPSFQQVREQIEPAAPAAASLPGASQRAPAGASDDHEEVGETAHMSVPEGLAAAAAAREALPFGKGAPGVAPRPAPPAELPPQRRHPAMASTVGLTSDHEAKLRALASIPFDGRTPRKKEFLSTVAIVEPESETDSVGETAHMSVPEGLAAAAAAREALPFGKGAPGVAPPPAPPAELPPQRRHPAMASTVGLTSDDEAKLRALASIPFDGRTPKKNEFLSTVPVVDNETDPVGETAHMGVPEGLAAAAAARAALNFPKSVASPPTASSQSDPVLPPLGQLVEIQAAMVHARDRDALLASRGYSAAAWQSVLRRYGALMQADPNIRTRYEALLDQAKTR